MLLFFNISGANVYRPSHSRMNVSKFFKNQINRILHIFVNSDITGTEQVCVPQNFNKVINTLNIVNIQRYTMMF